MITLLVALALLVVMASVALVLDRLWLMSARAELTVAAESAALVAAREIVGDERLKAQPEMHHCLCRARKAGIGIAQECRVAGQPVELRWDGDQDKGDIRFGRLVTNDRTGLVQFIENESDPNTVVVTARRTHSRNNPVALFFRGLTGQMAADVVAQAEAGLDNHVIGVRPLENAPVPALPLAILKFDPTGRASGWDVQIEQNLGFDNYSFDSDGNRVNQWADGIREIILKTRTRSDNDEEINVRLLDIGHGPSTEQITRGWTRDDLEDFDGRLDFARQTYWIDGTDKIESDVADDLKKMIGQPRIVLLYDVTGPGGSRMDRAHCLKPVAGRIMDIYPVNGGYEIVFQPAILTTRTLLSGDESTSENRYLYKVQLTQ